VLEDLPQEHAGEDAIGQPREIARLERRERPERDLGSLGDRLEGYAGCGTGALERFTELPWCGFRRRPHVIAV
jgi:hypothetical protein